jgi:lysophospholipase L1-like esterase
MSMRLAVAAAAVALAVALASACDEGRTSAPTASPTPAAGAYLALGDSLSFGIGASDPGATGFVALIHQALGDGFELVNLGVPGHTSQDLIDGPLADGVSEITARRGNADPANDVRLITLEIGGNDLLRLNASLVETGVCGTVDITLNSADCYLALAEVLEAYEPNLDLALAELRQAAPETPIVLLTLYNPLNGLGERGRIADLALEGMPGTRFEEGMNDIMRRVADAHGVTVVDLYPPFQEDTRALISADFIHPNDAGYRAMAAAALEAFTPQAELP